MKTTILQLPPKFIGAAMKKGGDRPVLEGILVDADERAVVATNGRALVTVPIPGAAAVKGGYITPELWKSATIMAKKGPVILDYAAGTVAGLPYQTMEEWGQNYANWKAVVSRKPATAYRTRLDPEVLLNAAIAIGCIPGHKELGGVTLDLPADYREPISLHVQGGPSGLIMGIHDMESNESGHGPRTSSTPEHSPNSSPSTLIHQPSPFHFDRAAMLADPIAWLRKLDEELRYLNDFTPHGRYIYDYLTIGERAKDVDAMEEERDEAVSEKEDTDQKVTDYEALITTIVESFEATMFDSIDSAAGFLHELKETITEADIVNMFNHPKVHERLSAFEEIAVPKSEADFESIKAERDQYRAESSAACKRIIELEKELTQARSRITAIEAHSSPSTINSQPSTINSQPSTSPPTLTRNSPRNGIELRFDGKPTDLTRDALKSMGFRWAPGQPDKPWIAKYTEERWVFATALAEGKSPETRDTPEITGIEDAPGLSGLSGAEPEHSCAKPSPAAATSALDLF